MGGSLNMIRDAFVVLPLLVDGPWSSSLNAVEVRIST